MHPAAEERFVFRHHPLLGTVVEVVVTGVTQSAATAVDAAVTAEIERLEDTFSAFRPDSELSRWKRGELVRPSAEFCELMTATLQWQLHSAGAFNPLAGLLSAEWSAAEAAGRTPDHDRLRRVARSIAEPRFELRGGVPVLVGECAALNLNAIAKGYIVDRALVRAFDEQQPSTVLISAGGDVAQRGRSPSTVGIENPLRPYDNEPPLQRISIRNEGLATSGGARRGVTVAGRRYSHVLDPRSGDPVDVQASISVVAPSAMVADVVATVAGVMEPGDAVRYVESLDGVGALVVDPGGVVLTGGSWHRHAIDAR